MKILIGCSSYPPHIKGGGEISTQELAEGLRKLGHEVIVVAIAHERKLERIKGVKIYRIKSPNIYWSFESHTKNYTQKLAWHTIEAYNIKIAGVLLDILRKEKPDIVHTSTIEDLSAYVWKVAKLAGYPVVHTIRSYTLLCPRGSMFKNNTNCSKQCLSCKLLTFPKKHLSAHVDHVVGNSRFILDRHLQYGFFPQAETSVIYNIYKNEEQQTNRETKEKLHLGFIGRLHPIKGVELLIDAFKEADISSVANLTIAGSGDEAYVQFLLTKAANSAVKFLGAVQAAEFYNQIDVVISPSLWEEPLSRVIFEAYAHGKPVLGSRRGGTPEIVIKDQTGLLFDPHTSTELTGLLRKLAYNQGLVRSMSVQCLDKAKEFLPSRIIAKHMEVYKSL